VPSVKANGLTFEYETFGNPRDRAMLLIMGQGVQMIAWPDGFCGMLAEKGFHVVRFDNRDAGLSSQLDHLGTPNITYEYFKYMLRLPLAAPYLIDDMARDSAGVIDALGLAPAHVVGASMGGMIAQNLAVLFPAKVSSLTSIMSTTGSRALPGPRPRALKALMQKPARPGDTEGAKQRLKNLVRAIGSETHPADEGELDEFCERHAKRAQNGSGGARQLVAIAASGDRTPVIRRIRVPTLVIHGDEDPLLTSPGGVATAKAITEGGGDARYVEIEGMGHDFPRPLWPRIVDLIAEHCRTADRARAA
jgi:proline iminopeptidase